MELVVDANILFAALIKDSHTRHLLLSSSGTFYIPEFFFEEMHKHINVLSKKTGLSKEAVKDLFDEFILTANIIPVPFSEFREHLKKATVISPDKGDIPYFALALKIKCPIWSNDKKLQEQKSIKIYTTEELSK